MDHAAEGLFDGAAVTTWNRGSTAEVIWAIQAHHMGMYNRSRSDLNRDTMCSFLFQEGTPIVSAKFLLEASLRSLNNALEMDTCHSLEMTHGYGRRRRGTPEET